MFGKKTSTGTKAVVGGLAMTILQTMISRRVAGRAAGMAARGGAGIPGLLIWLAVGYAANKFFNRQNQPQSAATTRR